jgi:hypothetical protein
MDYFRHLHVKDNRRLVRALRLYYFRAVGIADQILSLDRWSLSRCGGLRGAGLPDNSRR